MLSTGRVGETPEAFRIRTLVNAQQWTAQMIHAERVARQEAELDRLEDECLRMFGVEVTYCMDERILA